MRQLISTTTLLFALAFAPSAMAQQTEHHAPPTPEQRAKFFKQIHTGFVVELGALLDLDTPGTLKLGDQLQPFDDQRIQLRLDNADAMHQLHDAAHNDTPLANAATLARKLMQNRVQLAQIDQAEAEAVLKTVPADKVAKVAVFMAEYAKRVERKAHEIHRDEWNKRNGPPPEE